MTKGSDSLLQPAFTMDDLEQMRKDVKNELERKTALSQRASNKQRQTQQALLAGRTLQKQHPSSIFGSFRTQVKHEASVGASSSTIRVAFRGQSPPELEARKCEFIMALYILNLIKRESVRYMFETLNDRSSGVPCLLCCPPHKIISCA